MKRVSIALVLSVPLALGPSIPHVGATHARVPTSAAFAGSWYYHGLNVDVTAEQRSSPAAIAVWVGSSSMVACGQRTCRRAAG